MTKVRRDMSKRMLHYRHITQISLSQKRFEWIQWMSNPEMRVSAPESFGRDGEHFSLRSLRCTVFRLVFYQYRVLRLHHKRYISFNISI